MSDMTTDRPLEGRGVVITGAGAGLGRAYAVGVAAAGASVVVNDIAPDDAASVVEHIRAKGGRAIASIGDVSDPAYANTLIQACVDQYGAIDGLVNNAGVLHESQAWETPPEKSTAMVKVNVLGTIFCGQAAMLRMRAQGSGSIVNITSGTHLGQPRLAVYGATKGAVASLTYGWALDLAGSGVRTNALSPLAVTAMKLPPYDGHAQPHEIADAVVFLLSDSSTGISGQLVRRARNQLGLIAHPKVGTMLEADAWPVEAIDEAFRQRLRAELEPIGFGAHILRPGLDDSYARERDARRAT
jgi:NAD(P)-dependent dehydrogenase (short-subunit alcohol dehydrogenase family)